MKEDRENQLIEDVAWMRGKMESYFDQVAPNLATKESVEAVNKKIDAHTANHISSRGLVAAWCGVAVAIITTIWSKIGGN